MTYVLSQGTADKLTRLLNKSDVGGSGASGGSNRQEGWVEITVASEGEYEGTVTYYDAVNLGWETFASVIALPANDDDTLVVGRRYMGQRSGDTLDGGSVWVVNANSVVEACCGLRIVEEEDDPSGCDAGTIVLDGESAAGEGINWSAEECNFYLDKGCGITFEGGKKIGVQSADLAGPGLVNTVGCKLEVDAGNCLEIGEDGKLNVNLSGTFSAVTAITLSNGCPSPQLAITTTAFSFNNCSLEQDSYSTSYISLPCCYPCIDDPPPPPCDQCDFTVTINGVTYAFVLTGSTYIAEGPGGNLLYLTPPGDEECEGFWSIQLYDGNLELCKWEAEWNGQGCVVLEQGTNNGIPFTECPAEFVDLCCDEIPDGECCDGVETATAVVSGVTSDECLDCAGFNRTWNLAFDTEETFWYELVLDVIDCQGSTSATVYLYCNGPNMVFELFAGPDIVATYKKPLSEWDCDGENIMSLDNDDCPLCCDYPATVTVTMP
jgi:hypothetical protein